MDFDLLKLHRLFYPQVPLVLCSGYRGRVSAMPVVSYSSLSDSPPLVGVSCSPLAFTTKLAIGSRAFALCLLDRTLVEKVERLAITSGAKTQDKLDEVGLSHVPGTAVDAPIITDAAATIECSLVSRRKIGDHIHLVGRVKACRASSDFSDFWRFQRYRPILYTGWRGGMTTYRKN